MRCDDLHLPKVITIIEGSLYATETNVSRINWRVEQYILRIREWTIQSFVHFLSDRKDLILACHVDGVMLTVSAFPYHDDLVNSEDGAEVDGKPSVVIAMLALPARSQVAVYGI